MKALLLSVMLLSGDCESTKRVDEDDHFVAGQTYVTVAHDDKRGVTCWVVFRAGISCLPDSQVTR